MITRNVIIPKIPPTAPPTIGIIPGVPVVPLVLLILMVLALGLEVVTEGSTVIKIIITIFSFFSTC